MSEEFESAIRSRGLTTRIFIYALLIAFNAYLWLLLWAFQWQISLRAREVQYFGRYLFPIRAQVIPLPAIYASCAVLSAVTAGIIIRDRRNLAVRERLRILLAQILESLEIGVIVIDRKGQLILRNESAHRLMSLVHTAPSGTHYEQLLSGYPDIREIVAAGVEKGSYVNEVEHNLSDADASRTVRITTLPLKDRGKRISGTLLLVHDVSEVTTMERQVQTAERLSALGTLAAALAHEIRNPLEALNLNLALLGRNLDTSTQSNAGGDKRKKYFAVLEDEIARLSGILDNFLSFARPSQSPICNLRLDGILRQVVELVENQALSQQVSIGVDIEGEDFTVHGSEDQLKQAFLNLMINALEAMPEGGRLSVRAESHLALHDAPPMVVVRICDTGKGIAPDKLGRLFDPFFSLKPQGTGLGLTIAHRVVQQHRGRIRVESAQGKGTTFTLELPLVPGEQ